MRLVKKYFIIILSLLLIATGQQTVYAQEDIITLTKQMGYQFNPANKPKASIVIDADNGDILWADNIDLKRDPASTTKIMTLFLLYEAIDRGEVSLDTSIIATKSDEAIGKLTEISNNDKIFAGVAYPIRELIPMVLVPSSNVATVMIANHLSNNDTDLFIDKMNQRAKELGMYHTTFYNATGAVARAFGGHYRPKRYDNFTVNETTVRDFSILTYHFLKKYDDILQWTKDSQVSTMVGTPYEEKFHSYNHSLKGELYAYEGTDGLKTGSSPSAGFNIIMTTKREDRRLITVLMGTGDWRDQNGEYYRHPFANAITEYAFTHFDRIKLFDKGENSFNDQDFTLDEDLYVTVQKGTNPHITLENEQLSIENNLEQASDKLDKRFDVKLVDKGILHTVTNAVKNPDKVLSNDVSRLVIYLATLLLLILFILIIKLFRKK